MKEEGTVTELSKAPNCDFCGAIAKFDGKTTQGPWAYMCGACMKIHGVGLGMGKGQKIVVKK